MKSTFPAIATCMASLILTTVGASALDLTLIGRYGQSDEAVFGASAAEIPAYDPASQRVFVTNAATASVDIISIADPSNPTLFGSIPLGGEGISGPTSVVFTGGVLAVSLAADPRTDNGQVAFFDADGNPAGSPVEVGALPDAITVSPDGTKLVTSNEGEPNVDNTIDPEGSVSVIDISNGIGTATVRTATFGSFNSIERRLKAAGIRIFGQLFVDTGEVTEPEEEGDEPEPIYAFERFTTVAEDLEPEFATVSADNSTAFVTLQENNGIAVVDLDSATVRKILPLGLKDHSKRGDGFDSSDKDDVVGNIQRQKVLGIYMPDAIASFTVGKKEYLVTANEGDSRVYDNFSEEIRGGDLEEEGFEVPGSQRLLADDALLGRLKTTIAPPQTAVKREHRGTTYLEAMVGYGARSFSIWSAASGKLVYDSGDDFERMTLAGVPDIFNASNDGSAPDNRSDDKGPEPEGVAVATIGGKPYAFITLERVGGVMVYDLSDPEDAKFVDYENTRLFADQEGANTVADDLGPEGLIYIKPSDSPTGQGLLVVTNEVSGSTLVFGVVTEGDDHDDDGWHGHGRRDK